MKLNLKAFAIGFTAALIIYLASIFIWQVGFLAPILGGILVAYIAAENYKEGTLNGALVGSLAALTAVIIAFFGVFIINTDGSAGIDIIRFTIFGALDVIIGAILGSIGGLIGYYLENRIVSADNEL
ncbi:MAG TPA: DUF5518 domain-containing protein [Methanobacterium sp.]|nr:DUF5518 domain-containing protein [Methanobacterium sp.]